MNELQLEDTGGMETCDKCGASLLAHYGGKVVHWVCLVCHILTIEEK